MITRLSSETYDRVCSMLLGNGCICTTVGPTGYHASPELLGHDSHATQHFVWAARRADGPRHRLTNFGSLSRTLFVNGKRVPDADWEQELDCSRASAVSRIRHAGVTETSRTAVAMGRNVFMVETELIASAACDVRFDVLYTLGDLAGVTGAPAVHADMVEVPYTTHDDVGTVRICGDASSGGLPLLSVTRHAIRLSYSVRLETGRPVRIRTLVQFSDRRDYGFPVTLGDWDELQREHLAAWRSYYEVSELTTGDASVDGFRELSLYAIRTQLTDWSIGPTLSERYWGGGAFHDEMYPFYALISGGHADLALRMPRFRLLTLRAARERARGRGAVYPWSSTETGAERDPEGLWLTERFHLAQFSAQIWAHWLYERDIEELDALYPVLRGIASYFEQNVIERTADGGFGTRPCVDFDESVGAVRNGPFTVSGASAALRWASEAAEILGHDALAVPRWRSLAGALSGAIVRSSVDEHDAGEVFGIPDGVPLHYSVLGHIFPFMTEPSSERARRTARYIHRVCRSSRGWKPGADDVYTGSNWTWTAGHLAIVHSMLGDADRAWEAVRLGPEGSGPGPTPCEHLDRNGVPQVPWFTTGVGAWLYGLHAAIGWLSDEVTHLWSGFPSGSASGRPPIEVPDPGAISFRGIRGGRGVSLSGEAGAGACPTIEAHARDDVGRWRFSLPRRVAERARVFAATVSENRDRIVYEAELAADQAAVLIEADNNH